MKTRLLIIIGIIIGIGIIGFGVYSVSSPSYFIENYSPGYPGSSEIPLYEGDSSPKEIPEYENNVGITPLNPNEFDFNPELDASVQQNESTNLPYSKCSGTAGCTTGIVTSIIDGDTIKVDGQSIRFALVDAPKLKYDGGQSGKFIEEICPVGSTVVVDQDDDQLQDKYGRLLGVVYCNDLNLNKELLDSGLGDLYSAFCDQSEFKDSDWAIKHGC